MLSAVRVLAKLLTLNFVKTCQKLL